MNRFDRLQSLFHEALEVEPSRRVAFLDAACPDDRELRGEVESLLAAHDEDGGFLETADAQAETSGGRLVGSPLVGQRIGAYVLEAEIGRGGMGTVYRAHRADEVFERVVAVKLIRPGLDSAVGLGRFESERRILARLDHPNIARLIDGGSTPDGQPYFVMEFVEGEPLGAYCNRYALGLRERLVLFATICEAVHAAHQSLVVHRDLKPSNILVTAAGVPKLLDFGIAKVLEAAGDDAAATVTVMQAMTPAYASPEQARGEPITTAADIYALGVVLCELIAGALPYPESATSQELIRSILERPPLPPSQLAPELLSGDSAGDLDNIVLMALRKEPGRRYASALQLAEDIRRHLSGQPVIARGDSMGYRARKFIRRHRVGVAAGALAFLSLIAGVVLASWQAHIAGQQRAIAEQQRAIAERQRVIAERRFKDLRQVANSLLFEIHELIRDLPGSTPARALVVKRALAYLDGLSRDVGDDRELQRELAAAYQKLGDVQGSPFAPSLGDSAGARRSYEKAENLRLALSRASPADEALRRELAQSRMSVGDLLWITGDFRGALARYRKVLEQRKALANARPREMGLLKELRETHTAMGDVLMALGDYDAALASFRSAHAVSRRMNAATPRPKGALRNLAVSTVKIGLVLIRKGNYRSAAKRLSIAVKICERIVAAAPTSVRAKNDLVVALHALGEAELQGRRLEEALSAQRRALALVLKMVDRDPKNAVARRNRFASQFNIAEVLREMGNTAKALAAAGRAVAYAEQAAAPDLRNAQAKLDLELALLGQGRALAAAKQWDGALAVYRRALGMARALLAAAPGRPTARADVARILKATGKAQLGRGSVAEAARSLEETRELYRGIVSENKRPDVEVRRALAHTLLTLGEAYARLGRIRDAHGAYAGSVASFSRLRRMTKRLRPADLKGERRALAGMRLSPGSR